MAVGLKCIPEQYGLNLARSQGCFSCCGDELQVTLYETVRHPTKYYLHIDNLNKPLTFISYAWWSP